MAFKFLICMTVLLLHTSIVFSSGYGGRRSRQQRTPSFSGNVNVDPSEQVKQLEQQIQVLQKQLQLQKLQQEFEKLKPQAVEDKLNKNLPSSLPPALSLKELLPQDNLVYAAADGTRDIADGLQEFNRKALKPNFERMTRTTTGLFAGPLAAIAKPFGVDRLVKGGQNLLLKTGSHAYDLVSDAGYLGGQTAADILDTAGEHADNIQKGVQDAAEFGQGFFDQGLDIGQQFLDGALENGQDILKGGLESGKKAFDGVKGSVDNKAEAKKAKK